MDLNRTLLALAAIVVSLPATAAAQEFDDRLMALKDRFEGALDEAVAEPFVGLRTSEGIEPGLFPVHATGVSTEPVRLAADAFLHSLTPTQLMRTQFRVQDEEWRRWLNVDNGIYSRRGTPLAEMTDEQRNAAMDLLAASLSARGVEQSQAIMLTDQALRELNPQMAWAFSPDLYYFTVMGLPSATEPWGWQLDGHHLIINYFVLGDQVVMTPTFWGAEPAVSRQGSTEGNAVLQSQQDLGVALMQSLSPEQQEAARIAPAKAPQNLAAGAFEDNLVLDFAGLPAAGMSHDQQHALLALIENYVGTMRDQHAAIRMVEVAAHLAETHFAWIGGTGSDDAFYYRIHSPVILIEFDHQQPAGTGMINTPGVPTRDHIHTIVRTPNGNDYGRDLLRQHLEQSHSH